MRPLIDGELVLEYMGDTYASVDVDMHRINTAQMDSWPVDCCCLVAAVSTEQPLEVIAFSGALH